MTFELQAYYTVGAKCEGSDVSLAVLCQGVEIG